MIAPLNPNGRDEGKRRKRAALDGLAQRRAFCVLHGRRALVLAALARGWATADDVRAAVELPAEVNPVCLGAVPGPLAAAGIITADGSDKTARPKAHARPLTRWRLVDRDAALAWLGEYPDPGAAQRLLFDPGGPNEKPRGDDAGRGRE